MPYPDLGPSETFWRCAACGNEAKFLASGTGAVACGKCGRVWSVQQLAEAHAQAQKSKPA